MEIKENTKIVKLSSHLLRVTHYKHEVYNDSSYNFAIGDKVVAALNRRSFYGGTVVKWETEIDFTPEDYELSYFDSYREARKYIINQIEKKLKKRAIKRLFS